MRLQRWLLAIVFVVFPRVVLAQSDGFIHRLELSGGAGYFTGTSIGSATAALRANGQTPQPYALFATESVVTGSVAGDFTLGARLHRRWSVEGHFGYSRPSLETSVRGDAEGAAAVTVVERIDQFMIDAGVLFRIDEMRIKGVTPYAAGGAGYLRQLHEGYALIDQGHLYHLGGGLTRELMIRTHGMVRAAGLRADGRMYILAGGLVNGRTARHGSFTASLFVRF
jgi:hypothetical protein